MSARAPCIELPSGFRALTPCATTIDPSTHELRCLHKHAGKHLRTSPGASVTLLPSGLVHIVESCGGYSKKHTNADNTQEGDDPYMLWYVMAAPSATGLPGTGGLPCSAAAPYAEAPYSLDGTPNPNNPDPTGAFSLVTRHWPAGVQVPYIVNIPPSAAQVADIFAGPGGVPLLGAPYTQQMFANDIDALMNGVNTLHTANVPTAVRVNYPSTPTDPTPTYTSPGSVITTSGQFIWSLACGGPTGNGLNEFVFLPTVSGIPQLLGGAVGGLSSMLVNPKTGVISECDTIFESDPSAWGGLLTQTNSGLAHEVGHFWGLDHTNLHPGGPTANPTGVPFLPTLRALYSKDFNDVPAMTASFTRTLYTPAALAPPYGVSARNRVSNPWLQDDIAAFSILYPVTSIASSTKTPLINETASIVGSVTHAASSFGHNIFVVNDVGVAPLTLPPVGTPWVGTVSGTYRSGPQSVTGVSDTIAGAPCTGEFRLDGIPVSAPRNFALCVEPLGSLGFGGGTLPATASFGEWWYESILNMLNLPPVLVSGSVAYVGYWNISATTLPALPVSSMRMAPGTIIRLPGAIDMNTVSNVLQSVPVSRPLVEVFPRNSLPLGGTLTITVSHNRAAAGIGTVGSSNPFPLQSLTCKWKGTQLPTSFVSSTNAPGPAGGTMRVSVYSVAIPANLPQPATVTVLALEVPDLAYPSIASVVGENQVCY